MTEVFGGFEEADGFIDGPGALFGVGVDGDAGVFFVNCGEGFVDCLVNEVGNLWVFGVSDAGGGGDSAWP